MALVRLSVSATFKSKKAVEKKDLARAINGMKRGVNEKNLLTQNSGAHRNYKAVILNRAIMRGMRKIILVLLLFNLSIIAPAQADNKQIDYSAPANAPFTAEEVTVTVKGYTLAGTLLLPKSGKRPWPAVITITGSGQQTRDEPLPIPGLEKYKLMRQVAEALASRGIAVLRVDDRGVGGSGGRDTLMTATTSSFADDVRAEVAYLRSRSEIDPKRIALVGHSEGGMIAPMVAATDPQIAAIALMAGSGKRGDLISKEQLEDALAPLKLTPEEKDQQRAKQAAIIQAVQSGADLSSYPAEVRLPWIKEFWTYDPLVMIRKVRQPILILQGALDRQITAEQAGMLEQAAREGGNKDVTKQIFPNLNHLFLPAKTGSFSEYATLETQLVGDAVLKTLGDWLVLKLRESGGKRATSVTP